MKFITMAKQEVNFYCNSIFDWNTYNVNMAISGILEAD